MILPHRILEVASRHASPLNRLTQAQGPYGDHQYHYDGVGNRNSLEINGLIEHYHYAQDSQQLQSKVSESDSTQYSYNRNGNVTTAGDLSITYDKTGRSTVFINSSHENPGVMVQRYSPEGWRDIKIGSGIATLFAHNSQGQLLSEQNHPLDALTQDTRHEVQNVLVAQLAQAIATGHPLTEPVAEQAAEILYATLEEQHNNDEIQNLVIDTIQSLVEQLPGLNAQLPSLSDQATRLASAEAKWRIKPQLREYIYLQGQPLAMITSRQAGAPNELFRIHTDHLGTPMWVTDGLGVQRVWDPILEPFGNIHQEGPPPIEGTIESFESDLEILTNHSSTETQQAIDISMPLRFAGQYFDTETQLHYNYFRDYDPSIGRYVQSDPIGLGGGVNTYGYVGGNPVAAIDPYGLDLIVITGGVKSRTNPFGHIAIGVQGYGIFSYGNGTPLGSSVANYVQSQSTYRNQLVTIIRTTKEQDAAAAEYFRDFPGMNNVSEIDNCSVRTSGALRAAGLPIEGSIFPGALAREARTLLNSESFFIEQGAPVSVELQDYLFGFSPIFGP